MNLIRGEEKKNKIFHFKKNKTLSGTTLIEALVVLFIFVLITTTFYSVWSLGSKYIILSRNKLIALSLANEKLEVIRNLAFDDIALTTSVPAGNIQENEDILSGGKTFHVFTQIKKEDDPTDGTLGGTPNDVAFVDYKDVRVTVSWDGGQQSTNLSSRFVPAGLEQTDSTLGALVVNVYSDQPGGAGIAGSTVRVINSSIGFNETHSTDSSGRLVLNGLPADIQKYQIHLTKDNYETVDTLPPYPTTPYNPVDVHASVVAGAVNTINIVQDELVEFKVQTNDYMGNPSPDIKYQLKGGRRLGMNGTSPVYNLDVSDQTDAQGTKDYGPISPGQYTLTLNNPGYSIIGIDPGPTFSLSSGDSAVLTVKVGSDSVTSLLANVKKSDDSSSISGASVHLTNSSGYDTTITTGADGMAFFPNVDNPPFSSGDYAISVTAPGYQDYSGNVTIDASQMQKQDILMNAL